MNIYEAIENCFDEELGGAIATLVVKAGSAPRETGAKMFICEDGRTFGTIGGGQFEAQIIDHAKTIILTGRAELVHYMMNVKQVQDEGMICGGNVDVLIEPVLKKYRELYKRIGYCERRGRTGVVITRFGDNLFSKTVIEPSGACSGDVIEEQIVRKALETINGKKPQIKDGIAIEQIRTVAKVYLFGAGHVSEYVSRTAKMVDFDVTVIDDRKDFANRERFPEADQVIAEDFSKVFDLLDFDGDVYAVIVTRGHAYDASVLEEVLKRSTKYVGMIGSKKKVKAVFDYIGKRGYSGDVIGRVYAPIGIEIESETPQEIAVSIVAQLIQVRAGG